MSDRLFNGLFSTHGMLRAGAGLALMVLGSVAVAQDANNGKVLYTNKGCSAGNCHGEDPSRNFQGILAGANDPNRILAECATESQMVGFCSDKGFLKVVRAEAVDIAAYLANPNALGPAITLNTNTLNFRRSVGGGATSNQTVTVTNSGDANLVLTTVVLAGNNAADFKLSTAAGQCANGLTVAAKASCKIDIAFDPSVVANREAAVTITPDAGTGLQPVTIALTGVGTAAAEAFATADVAKLDFGVQALATTSGAKTIVVTSNGEANLTFDAANAFAISGTNADEFALDTTGSCAAGGVVSANGATCTLKLTFAPKAAGNRTATLTLNSNGTDLVVPLAGTALVADANEGGAGCSIANPNAAFDPMILSLLALALAVLGLRRRQQRD